MATVYAHRLNGTVAVLHKRRQRGTETHVTHVESDVADKACLLVDDMISTGGTLATAIAALLIAAARPDIWIAATHGLLLRGARQKLTHDTVRKIFVTDTVMMQEERWAGTEVVPIASVIAAALRRFLEHRSLSDLY